jgi:hypothetical protein
VRVDVLEVVVGGDGVEVLEDDVANALVLVGVRGVAATLPEKGNQNSMLYFCTKLARFIDKNKNVPWGRTG